MVDHAGDERKAHDQFEHPVGRQLGGVEERGGRAAAGENDGDPILRRAARWLILKGQQHEHQQDGRRRLLVLYGEGIDIDAATQRDLVERSEGVSGAFTKELTRQAWLRDALERRDGPTAEDLRRVLDELLKERSTPTRRLLGQPGDGNGVAQGGGAFQGSCTPSTQPDSQSRPRHRPQPAMIRCSSQGRRPSRPIASHGHHLPLWPPTSRDYPARDA